MIYHRESTDIFLLAPLLFYFTISVFLKSKDILIKCKVIFVIGRDEHSALDER